MHARACAAGCANVLRQGAWPKCAQAARCVATPANALAMCVAAVLTAATTGRARESTLGFYIVATAARECMRFGTSLRHCAYKLRAMCGRHRTQHVCASTGVHAVRLVLGLNAARRHVPG